MSIANEIHPKLQTFIDDITRIINEKKSETETTNIVAEKMRELIKHDDIFPTVYKRPNPDKYTLYPVYIAPDDSFSIASAVWDVGQSTPIHDHGTWGVIGLIQGTENEIHYALQEGSAPEIVMERNLATGEVMVCCTSEQDVHKVACSSDIPTVGVHVYGGNIGAIERHMYNESTGEVKKVITAWDSIPINE